MKKVLGGTSLEYNTDAGPLKYLIGTEQGYVFQANKRPGKPVEVSHRFGLDSGKHYGPIYALQRNPNQTKYFLTVGDWSAKVWCEDLKTPIMQTRYHSSYLTDGCWSPSRCGLFFLTRMDGFLDVWDFFYRQNEVAYSQKISDSPLTSISVMQSYAAIGDADGTVSMMQLCRPMYDQTMQPKEKEYMQLIFEREQRREKNLEIQKRLLEKKPAKPAKDPSIALEKKLKAQQEYLITLDENFFKHVAENDEDIEKIKQRGDVPEAEEEEKKEEPKEEAKDAKPAAAAKEEKKAETTPAPVQPFPKGSYTLKGKSYKTSETKVDCELKFTVVDDQGKIEGPDVNGAKTTGQITGNKFKIIQTYTEGTKVSTYEGEIEGGQVIGSYEFKDGESQEKGTIELSKV